MPRRLAAALALTCGALLLAACSSEPSDPSSSEAVTPSSAEAPETASAEPTETAEAYDPMQPGSVYNPYEVGATVPFDGWDIRFGAVERGQEAQYAAIDDAAAFEVSEGAEVVSFDVTAVRTEEASGDSAFMPSIMLRFDKDVDESGSFEDTYSPDAFGSNEMAVGDSFTAKIYGMVLPGSADAGNAVLLWDGGDASAIVNLD